MIFFLDFGFYSSENYSWNEFRTYVVYATAVKFATIYNYETCGCFIDAILVVIFVDFLLYAQN